MSVFGAFDVSATGLTAQMLRMDTISENLANINTTRDGKGNVYRRKMVVFEEKSYPTFKESLGLAGQYIGKGVKVSRIVEDPTEGAMVYDPSHPDADANGYVTYPNVNTVTEMTNLIDASRSYEANATAFDASKNIASRGLELGQS